MSSGADCQFYEKAPSKWYYDLQQYPYGETEEYDTRGPFVTFRAAERHLDRNHQNPGSFCRTALPGCKHDLSRLLKSRYEDFTHSCDRCGEHIKVEADGD